MSIDAARQRGATLVELIMFIIVVGVGVAGLVAAMNSSLRFSADPMQEKQLMAIAESLLGEVLQQPYTWCDPDDAAATTAKSYADCANSQDKGGGALTGATPGTETRYGTDPATVFDNVADYGDASSANGRLGNPIDDVTGGNAMAGYTASVAVTRAGSSFGLADDAAALAVTVTVTRDGQSFSLTGYRFRYAPRL